MADEAPDLLYSVDRAGAPVAIIERRLEGTQQEVLGRYPALLDGKFTLDLARLVNHFAREFQYEVLEDPEAYAAAYRAQVAAEDPDAAWEQGAPRLRDFGMPDFGAITRPTFNGTLLVFYAKSVQLGVPYRVEVPISGTTISSAVYEPVAMGPIEKGRRALSEQRELRLDRGWVASGGDQTIPLPLLQDQPRDHPPGGDPRHPLPDVGVR